jgi:hypothetical protein
MKLKSTPLLVATACACAIGLASGVVPRIAIAQISVSIALAPPPLPVYEQPILAEEGAIWAPGYWDYGSDGYFWVPGTWVQPPAYGLLWTPGYWGWGNGAYAWSAGYWGASVGFYGGVNYGFGYSGRGYTGGRWQGQHFYYNTAVNHVNVTNIHNTYTETTVNNTTVNRVSFNGGKGGLTARPTSAEQAAARAPHQPATALQDQHRQAAMASHPLLASVNHGKPTITATAKPAEFEPHKAAAAPRAPVHAADLPPVTHLAAKTTGNVERDNETVRQQNALRDTQEKQRQELQRSQAADHEKAAKQPAANGNDKELEQRHQAQTQELVERHATEQKTLQASQGQKPEESRDQSHSK